MALPAYNDRTWLTVEQLETHDPHAPHKPGERRFLCPLPPCVSHQDPRKHRSLSVDQHTGAWRCHRCGAAGQLEEYRTRVSPRERQSRDLDRRLFGSLAPRPAGASGLAAAQPGADPAAIYGRCSDLQRTSGADYLHGRGIDPILATAAGVRYVGRSGSGRPSVAFPVCDAADVVVALQARYLQVADGELKCLSRGPIGTGVFATPGALMAPAVAVCEAPIDALSLAMCGLPAVALCGSNSRPAWLRGALARSRVYVAMDSDDAGQRAAAELRAWLCFGPRPAQLAVPAPYKDWNEALCALGAPALRQLLIAAGAVRDADALLAELQAATIAYQAASRALEGASAGAEHATCLHTYHAASDRYGDALRRACAAGLVDDDGELLPTAGVI